MVEDCTGHGEPVCGAEQTRCLCCLVPGHAGPHVCDRPSDVGGRCGGSWEDDAGRLRVHRWPSGLTVVGGIVMPEIPEGGLLTGDRVGPEPDGKPVPKRRGSIVRYRASSPPPFLSAALDKVARNV